MSLKRRRRAKARSDYEKLKAKLPFEVGDRVTIKDQDIHEDVVGIRPTDIVEGDILRLDRIEFDVKVAIAGREISANFKASELEYDLLYQLAKKTGDGQT